MPNPIMEKGNGIIKIGLDLMNQDLPPGSVRVSAFSEHMATGRINRGTKQDLGRQKRRGQVDGCQTSTTRVCHKRTCT